MIKACRGGIRYFNQISWGKATLWCYLIWYLVTVYFHFDPSPKLWLNSVGISAVVGTGLVLSVASGDSRKPDPWQTFRLYLMPFCVSSFSALIKDQGFFLILSPRLSETLVAVGICAGFLAFIFLLKRQNPPEM